jgi:hypothetical protein
MTRYSSRAFASAPASSPACRHTARSQPSRLARHVRQPASLAIGAYAALSTSALFWPPGGRATARSPASTSAPKQVLPVRAHRMMLWATLLRRRCSPPFGQRSHALSSATSMAAIVRRSKRSVIMPKPRHALTTRRSKSSIKSQPDQHKKGSRRRDDEPTLSDIHRTAPPPSCTS